MQTKPTAPAARRRCLLQLGCGLMASLTVTSREGLRAQEPAPFHPPIDRGPANFFGALTWDGPNNIDHSLIIENPAGRELALVQSRPYLKRLVDNADHTAELGANGLIFVGWLDPGRYVVSGWKARNIRVPRWRSSESIDRLAFETRAQSVCYLGAFHFDSESDFHALPRRYSHRDAFERDVDILRRRFAHLAPAQVSIHRFASWIGPRIEVLDPGVDLYRAIPVDRAYRVLIR